MNFSQFFVFFSIPLIFVNANYTSEQRNQNNILPFPPQQHHYPSAPAMNLHPYYDVSQQLEEHQAHQQPHSPMPGHLPVSYTYPHQYGTDQSEQLCYRTTGSLPVATSSSVPNFIQPPTSYQHYGHRRDRSKSLSDIEVLNAQLEAAKIELQKAHITIADLSQLSIKRKPQRDIQTQTSNDFSNPTSTPLSSLEEKARQLLEKLHALSHISNEHQKELAEIISEQKKNPNKSPAPTGFSSLLPGAQKRAASALAAQKKDFEVSTYKDGTKQQAKIDRDLINIEWKIDAAITDLEKTGEEIQAMHHATLALIRKKTGQLDLKGSSTT
ncbi:hypothetical protein EBU24_06535 [bacterium]|nr:hypothetical protein [bacterium]